MKKYLVTADVDSPKYGKGQLVANLDEPDFITYANLPDAEKLTFLKEKGAEFKANVHDLEEQDVANFNITPDTSNYTAQVSSVTTPEEGTAKKMRVNINGNDTGWIDVNEETEEQYNQLMNRFNEMQREFDERFGNMFDFKSDRFFNLATPLLGDFGLNNNEEDTKKEEQPKEEQPKEEQPKELENNAE